MTGAVASAQTDAPRGRLHVRRLLTGALGVAVLWIVVDLLGWDVGKWFGKLWEATTGVSPGYLALGLALQTAQTMLIAVAWLSILRYAYPGDRIPYKPVLASYATGIALNGFLPAHLGTFVMMFLFLSFIPGATFPGVLLGWPVQKLFFTVAGAFAYVHLFASVPHSFHLTHKHVAAHPQLTGLLIAAGAVVVVLVARVLWRRVTKLWEQAKVGAKILSKPRVYGTGVVLPELLGWFAKLGVIGVFLAAYGIPVTFHTVMSVVGGNSLANLASVTPGALGITQAVSTASLSSVADPTTATACSLGQQLVTTTWNQLFAIVMLVWVFGWTGGRELVRQSYAKAKVEAARRARAGKTPDQKGETA